MSYRINLTTSLTCTLRLITHHHVRLANVLSRTYFALTANSVAQLANGQPSPISMLKAIMPGCAPSSDLALILMTRYYLLIAEEKELSVQSRFFRVAVGQSTRDQKLLQALSFFVASRKWYFERWSNAVDSFLSKIAESFGLHAFELHIEPCSISTVAKTIRSSNPLPSVREESREAAFLRAHLSLNYRISRQNSVSRKAEAGTRNKPKSVAKHVKVLSKRQSESLSADGVVK